MATIATMYKGVEGSPETKLVNAISNIATTITIQDASVLPAAPNFACLFDETGKVEVVEYTAKSGQNLTCIRGVSGQRLAWPIGTSVARNFTAIDYNRVVDNVSAMNVELNELSVEYQYLFDAVVEGDFVQQVLQMADEIDALHIEVNGLIDDLTTLESQLQANEQARQVAESSRVTAEGLRVTAESSRVTAESSRVASESTRQANESTRQTEETARSLAESDRVTAEGSRVTAESSRVDAESLRVTAEGQRVSAETARATAESTRVSAETIRNQKETQRQADETARATAESSRASAELQRANNETGRQANESQRQTTESQRNSAESLRATAESSRVTAESSRVSAESSRVTAENTRVANETNRQAQLTDAINAANLSAQQAQGFRDTAYSHAQYAESMRDAVAIFASDAEDAAVRAEYVASSLGGIQDWALQPTKPTYTYSEVGAAAATHYHIVSDIIDFPTSMPASDVYPWAKDESKPVYTAAEIGASEIGHTHDYAPSIHNHVVADIIDFPESMPASDVYEWAKQLSKPVYTYSEVGAAPLSHTHDYAPISHNHTKSQITDFPTSMPASDVFAWAKAETKPTYTYSEVGAASASHNHDLAYLGISAKAADSDLLDGNHASAFAAATHNHSAADITSGTLPAARGGTGVTTAAAIALLSYPVGAIYMSYASTSPATLFGGTWSALPTGHVLRTGTGGDVGGSDTVTLSSGHIPAMNIPIVVPGYGWLMSSTYVAPQTNSGWVGLNPGGSAPNFSGAYALWGNTPSAFSVVPKSYHIYAWRRTA